MLPEMKACHFNHFFLKFSSLCGGMPLYHIGRKFVSDTNKRFKEIEPSWRAQGITAIVMNPGYVKTGMSGGFGDLTPLQSAGSIKRTIENTTHADAGKFFDYDGKILPW